MSSIARMNALDGDRTRFYVTNSLLLSSTPAALAADRLDSLLFHIERQQRTGGGGAGFPQSPLLRRVRIDSPGHRPTRASAAATTPS